MFCVKESILPASLLGCARPIQTLLPTIPHHVETFPSNANDDEVPHATDGETEMDGLTSYPQL